MNKGERNELLVKLKLIQLRDNKVECPIFSSGKIETVGFEKYSYGELPPFYKEADLYTLDDFTLKQLCENCKVGKAGLYDKADIFINGIGYSLKSLESAPPALINHTARYGWEKVAQRIGSSIEPLDAMIEEYWVKRIKGIICEDVSNSNPNSPFKDNISCLKPFLNYFLFDGTALKDSQNPANFILDTIDALDIKTWKIFDKTFLDSHWDKLIFSVRATKGMGNYPNIKDLKKKESMEKWTKLFQGKYRGALHVRLSK